MKRNATMVECVLALALVLCIIVSVLLERSHGFSNERLVAAHAGTVKAEQVAAKKDTVYLEKKAAASQAREDLHPLRAGVLANPADTVRVKEYVAHVDTVLAKDVAALAAADEDVLAQRAVTDSVKRELAEALKPRYAPRLALQLAGWYNTLTAETTASATAEFRVIGHLSLAARAEHRVALVGLPRIEVGALYRF